MVKTSNSIIILQQNLSSGLFIIMISIIKKERYRITYLRCAEDCKLYLEGSKYIPCKIEAWCLERFRFGIHECVQRIWTVYDFVGGCGRGISSPSCTWGSSTSLCRPRPLPQDLLVKIFFVPHNSFYEMVRQANIYTRFWKSCYHTTSIWMDTLSIIQLLIVFVPQLLRCIMIMS